MTKKRKNHPQPSPPAGGLKEKGKVVINVNFKNQKSK